MTYCVESRVYVRRVLSRPRVSFILARTLTLLRKDKKRDTVFLEGTRECQGGMYLVVLVESVVYWLRLDDDNDKTRYYTKY